MTPRSPKSTSPLSTATTSSTPSAAAAKTKKLFTLVLIHDRERNRLLLGRKKRGIGVGLYNGFGGKVEKDNDADVVASALRELREEAGVRPDARGLARRGVLTFHFEDAPSEIWETHVFTGSGISSSGDDDDGGEGGGSGEPRETEEMEPRWFGVDEVPYEQMWLDDRYWLPLILGKQGEGERGNGEKEEEEEEKEEEKEEASESNETITNPEQQQQTNVIGEFFFHASSGPGSKIMTKHELRVVPLSGLPPLPSW